jgi:hypothetical protein
VSETSDRYHRSKATPEHRKNAASKSWELGYEAGWNDAADRWMSTPQFNDVGPTRKLNELLDQLHDVHLDGIPLSARFSTVLAEMAYAIRHCDDDTTTWAA